MFINKINKIDILIVYRPGTQLSRLVGDDGVVRALVVGKDRVVSGTKEGVVMEWALPDPKALVEEPKPQTAVTLSHTLCPGYGENITWMQVRHRSPMCNYRHYNYYYG